LTAPQRAGPRGGPAAQLGGSFFLGFLLPGGGRLL